MKSFKTKLGKFAVLAIAIIFCLSFIISANNYTAFATELPEPEEKIYWTGNIDEAFDGASVLVVIDKRTSEINKSYDRHYFGEFPIEEIRDLTYIDVPLETVEYLDFEEFRQILQIKLPIDSKENVVAAIKLLELRNDVISAEPNYIGSIF